MIKILFICHGNICRSPMAEFVMKHLVIAMDRNNLRNLRRMFGEDTLHKITLLMDYTQRPGDVADPWYTGDFEATWQDILEGCQGIMRSCSEL